MAFALQKKETGFLDIEARGIKFARRRLSPLRKRE